VNRWVTAAVVFCTASLPFQLRASGAYAPGISASSEKIDAILKDQMKRRGIPGLQAAIIDHGQIVFLNAYGVADIHTGAAVTDKTLFPINSATKAFTGVACMQLVGEGRLDLNAPVSNYLDGLPESWRAVTVRQLMAHISGLPDIIDGDGTTIEGGDEARAWAKVYTLPLQFKPGEHFSYNQTNYALLQRIVAKLSGSPFPVLVAKTQFAPAGMTSTRFGDSSSWRADTAVSYHLVFPGPDGKGTLEKVHEVYPPFMRSGAGINTSARELAQWLMRVQAGQFFKDKATLAQMWTPASLKTGEPGPRTPGWIVKRSGDHRAVGAEGGGRAAFAVYPEDGVAVILLSNLAGANPEELLDQIAAVYIPGFRLSGLDSLRVGLERRGFGNARALYDDLAAQDAQFGVAEAVLNRWAYRLLLSGKGYEALEIFKLVVSLHPDSGNAYDSLAGGYEALGDKAEAIANYKVSLELDPKNTNAVERLRALGVD
jgi:CubicO group peptidase (beta-lactamase class C family)